MKYQDGDTLYNDKKQEIDRLIYTLKNITERNYFPPGFRGNKEEFINKVYDRLNKLGVNKDSVKTLIKNKSLKKGGLYTKLKKVKINADNRYNKNSK
jgi:hypothetical protein